MKEQKINLKLELTEGYQKRFTESYCRRVLAKRNQQLIPPVIKAERKEDEENGWQTKKEKGRRGNDSVLV